MQFLLTKEELDNVQAETKQAALAYIAEYRAYIYKRAEAAINFASSAPLHEAPDRYVKSRLNNYDEVNHEPPLPSCLK